MTEAGFSNFCQIKKMIRKGVLQVYVLPKVIIIRNDFQSDMICQHVIVKLLIEHGLNAALTNAICDLKRKQQCRKKVNVYTPSTLSIKPKRPSYIYDRAQLSETLN